MDPSASPVPIRTAVADDVAALAALITHLGYPTGTGAMRERVERIAARDDYETFVAERDGRVVGFVGVMTGLSYNDDGPY